MPPPHATLTGMEKCLHDHAGTLLHVEYVMEADGVPRIDKVQGVDAKYSPIGPDLTPVLKDLLIMVGPHQVTNYLSLVTESIHATRQAQARRN